MCVLYLRVNLHFKKLMLATEWLNANVSGCLTEATHATLSITWEENGRRRNTVYLSSWPEPIPWLINIKLFLVSEQLFVFQAIRQVHKNRDRVTPVPLLDLKASGNTSWGASWTATTSRRTQTAFSSDVSWPPWHPSTSRVLHRSVDYLTFWPTYQKHGFTEALTGIWSQWVGQKWFVVFLHYRIKATLLLLIIKTRNKTVIANSCCFICFLLCNKTIRKSSSEARRWNKTAQLCTKSMFFLNGSKSEDASRRKIMFSDCKSTSWIQIHGKF